MPAQPSSTAGRRPVDFVYSGLGGTEPEGAEVQGADRAVRTGLADASGCHQATAIGPRADQVAAARKLFVDDGFADTSVEAITGAVLVSKGTFYHHFPDKKAMFVELYPELIQQVGVLADVTSEAIRATPDQPAMAPVAHLTHAFLRRTIDDPLHRQLMPQTPSVHGAQYRHINDTVAQPPIERL